MIWRLLAWIVTNIESVFRQLAGVDGGAKDMAQSIIQNQHVKDIFNNLVGFAIAMIIFFTVVKIIQDHYKEKDGGNPYKIVLRTFKGLLMFFFVTGAVTVGIYASQTIFQALDVATGGGNKSLAGQVFTQMAYDANRKRMGQIGDDDGFSSREMNKYWARISDPTLATSNQKYAVVQMKGDNRITGSSASRKITMEDYIEMFPAYKYAIVSQDGNTLTPMANWLKTFNANIEDGEKKELGDRWEDDINENLNVVESNDYYVKGNYEWKDGIWTGGSGSAGYHNDLLKGFSLEVAPEINLSWSPVDIWNLGYTLNYDANNKHDHSTTIGVFGNQVTIKMFTQFVNYGGKGNPAVTMKPMEETAKKFGITIKGGVSLQDGTANAYFDIDMFDVSRFDQILQTILVNVIYSNLAKRIVEFIPTFPAEFRLFILPFNFIKAFAPLVISMTESLVDETMYDLIPKVLDEDGNEVIDPETNKAKTTVIPFATKTSAANADIWFSIDKSSDFLPIMIQRFQIAGNFTDLWSQLTNQISDFFDRAEKAQDKVWDNASAQADLINKMGGKVMDQRSWQEYMGKIYEYNRLAKDTINTLGNLMYLYEQATYYPDKEGQNNYLATQGYTGSTETLETAIKNKFKAMAGYYTDGINLKKPSDMYADPTITMPIYQPIIEYGAYENTLNGFDVATIRDIMLNKVKVNMVIDDVGYYSNRKVAYQMVDWKAYGPHYNSKLANVADLYADNQSAINRSLETNPEMLINNSINNLGYLDLKESSSNWEEQGISYWLDKGGSNWSSRCTSGGASSLPQLCNDSYWGTKGIQWRNEAEPIYKAYTGTSAIPNIDNIFGKSASADDVTDNTNGMVLTSSASANAMSVEGKASSKELLQSMMPNSAETDVELQTEFQKNILTFRNIYDPADQTQGGDKKVLKEWVKTTSSIVPGKDSVVSALYDEFWDDNRIDEYVAGNTSKDRFYLLLTKEGTLVSAANLGSYVGLLSYADYNTVNALYDFSSMNFAVGYIAIIAAAGVYMNFVFGLIQRAVNMAVLYIMSPVTIAFYPFDDGQRFKSSFVTPFYKEAISAYAIIISLNLFIVLLEPVQNAARIATGATKNSKGDLEGSAIIGFFALVAFVTMLPKIRDSITSILGASSIQSRGIGDVFNDAKKTMSEPFATVGSGAKKLAHGAARVREGVDRMKAHKQDRNREELKRLQELKDKGQLGWWGERRLNKLSGAAESQKRIDEARESHNYSKLSKSELRRLNRQNKAADAEAQRLAQKQGLKEGTKAYDDFVASKKGDLLKNDAFKKSVNGVVAATRLGRFANRTVGKAGRTVAGGVSKGLTVAKDFGKAAATKVKNSGIGLAARSLGNAAKNSLVGEMIRAEFGVNGRRTQNKDSLWGEYNRWRDPVTRMDAQKQIAAKDRAYASKVNDYREQLMAAMGVNETRTTTGNKIINEQAKKILAYQEAEKLSDADKLRAIQALKTTEYMKKGDSYDEAQKKAYEDMLNVTTSGADVNEEFKKLGGASKVAEGLAKGLKEFADAGIKLIDFDSRKDDIAKIESEIRADAKGDKATIQAKLSNAKNKQSVELENYTAQIAKEIGMTDDASMKNIKAVLSNADQNTSFADIVGQISSKLNIESVQAEKAMAANYSGFAQGVQFNQEVARYTAALEAREEFDKGAEMFRSKIGSGVPKADADAMIRHFNNVQDEDIHSTNEESLGYKINQIIQKYDKGMDDAACQIEVDQLSRRMKAELTEHIEQFGARNASAIREHDIAQKYKQEMEAVEPMSILKEINHQREHHISMNMDVPSVQTLINDTMLQEMHDKGNYRDAGIKIQQLVDNIISHNFEEAAKLGFNEDTIEKLKQWEAQGELKRLEGIRGLGVFDASNMGSVFDNMGGGAMSGMQTALARITSVAEKKVMIDKFGGAIENFLQQEASARASVKYVLNSIDNTFAGAEWADLYGKIKDMNGHTVTNEKEFTAALKETLRAVHDGKRTENDELVSTNMKALINFRSLHKGDRVIEDAVRMLQQDGMAKATAAVEHETNANALRNKKSSLESQIAEITLKMKPFADSK